MSRSSRTANAAARVHSLRAANDNRRRGKSNEGRHTVLVHCGIQPVLMGQAAGIGGLVQQWPIAANDNATACGPKKEKE